MAKPPDNSTPSTNISALHLLHFKLVPKVTQVTEALPREVGKGALAFPSFHLLDASATEFKSPTNSLTEFSVHIRVLHSLRFLLCKMT